MPIRSRHFKRSMRELMHERRTFNKRKRIPWFKKVKGSWKFAPVEFKLEDWISDATDKSVKETSFKETSFKDTRVD